MMFIRQKVCKTFLVGLILSIGIVSYEGLAEARTLTVGSGQMYSTIQAGIDVAVTSDTVLVSAGSYVENINFLGKGISVVSVSGAATTIIDGNGSGSVVTFGSGEGNNSVLQGFTIRNGKCAIMIFNHSAGDI